MENVLLVEQVLDDFFNNQIDKDTIHLVSYDEFKQLERQLTNCLRRNNIDLSFKCLYSPRYDTTFSGNPGAIAWSFLHKLMIKAWHPITPEQLKDIEINNVYTNDRFGCVQIGTTKDVKIVNEYKHVGIGSMSSIIETTTNLYVDDKNNILVVTSTLTYD